MTFFNLIFLFLFSLIPLSVVSQQPPSVNHSRDTSPVVTIRAPNLWYEFPGSRNVYCEDPGIIVSTAIPVPTKRSSLGSERHLIQMPTEITTEVKSVSLPDESRLAQITALTSNQNLSQSTERFNLLREEIAGLREILLKCLTQLKGNPENPS